MVDLPEKVSSYMILGALVQMLFFQDGAIGHLGFGSLATNVKMFGRDWEIIFCKKSIALK